MLKSFATGAIAGAVAVWWFKDAIRAEIDERTRTFRRTTASRLHAVAETIEHAFEGGPRDVTRARIARAS